MYKANLNESVVTGYGLLNRKKVAIGVMDSNFMMGSMGKVVGEKITRLIEFATKEAIIKSINEQVLLSDIEVFLENNELKCRYKNYKIKVSIAHEKIWQLDLQYVRISMKNIKVLIILTIGIPSWIQSKLILKKTLAYRYKKLRKWCKFVIRLFRYQVIVRGSENIPNDEAVLFVSNHQDGFDPAIIISASPVPISFVSKKQNAKLPLFGSCTKTIENIHFNRIQEKRIFIC